MQVSKVNLIITDYCMPGMTGYELLKRIKVLQQSIIGMPDGKSLFSDNNVDHIFVSFQAGIISHERGSSGYCVI